MAPRRAAADAGCAVITRSNVASCAVAASALVQAGRDATAAAEGRRTATAPWFPSNPTLTVSAAQRSGGVERGQAFNVYATLAQEIDVAGQRASRRRAAEADVAARSHDTTGAARRVAADAYRAYFDVLAAREALAVTRRLEAIGEKVARVTRARADAGVASTVDAEVTEAASLRLVRARIEAERAERVAMASLVTLLAREPAGDRAAATRPAEAGASGLRVEGDLAPLAGSDAVAASAASSRALAAPRERPEVRALEGDARAFAARAEAFRRQRYPSLTLQIFAQNDGFDERVLGAGLALPLPLPQPVGRTYAGESAESQALASQRTSLAEHLARVYSGELAVALADYEARRAEALLYSAERLARIDKTLADMAAEIEAGRLAVRDAVVAQRELTDVVRGHVEARHALALASVDLALAAGVALEGAAK